MSRTQLLVYTFGPDADFEGQLVGALERIESGGAIRIADALFVGSDPETGELVAAQLGATGAGGALAQLLEFRLDPARRQRATDRLLGADAGVPADTVRELAASLGPGGAMLAVTVEHAWMGTLEDAVARTGGEPQVNEFVDAASLAELGPRLLAHITRIE
jgi:hypothetical protein